MVSTRKKTEAAEKTVEKASTTTAEKTSETPVKSAAASKSTSMSSAAATASSSSSSSSSAASSSSGSKGDGERVERVIIEVACVMLLLVLSGGCLLFFHISPLSNSIPLSPALSFLFAVAAIYATFRLYFGAAFVLLARLQATPFISNSKYKDAISNTLVTSIALLGLGLLYSTFPVARKELAASLWASLGDLPAVLQKGWDKEKPRVYERSWKMLGLLTGWALFFFAFELVIRVSLWLGLGVARAVGRGLKKSGGEGRRKGAVSNEASAAGAVADEGEGGEGIEAVGEDEAEEEEAGEEEDEK